MLKVKKFFKEEDETQNIVKLSFALKAPRYVALTDNIFYLEYPLHFTNLKNIGEAVVFSLLPIVYSEACNIELPDNISVEPETQNRVNEICTLWNRWFLLNRKVKVFAKMAAQQEHKTAERSVAQLFSGGIDSLATYKRRMDEVKYLIFYKGADIRLNRPERLNEVKNYVETFTNSQKKESITITTNIHHLHPVSWLRLSHGCAMIGPVLILSHYIKKLYIASSYSGEYAKKKAHGSNPALVSLISCSDFQAEEDGSELKRTEKVELIHKDARLLKAIRACGAHVESGLNCGQCEKCYRTTVALTAFGVDPTKSSFPKEAFSFVNIARFLAKNRLDDGLKVLWCENLELLESPTQDYTDNKDRLISALRKNLGSFYLNYKNGFAQGYPKDFEYISKGRKIETMLGLKPDSLLWLRRFKRAIVRKKYEQTFS